MPVYDFNNSPAGSKEPVCTYTVFYTNEPEASERPRNIRFSSLTTAPGS